MKLTKTQLREEQVRLDRLQKYLPTLQLKKALLQGEIAQSQGEIERLVSELSVVEGRVEQYAALLTEARATELFAAVAVDSIDRGLENIAGVEVPTFKGINYQAASYSLFDTPLWFESAAAGLKQLIEVRAQVEIAEARKRALEKEWRAVSVRVNLFEKILIPRAQGNIKKIRIFISDQQLAAVSQAKVAKKKILLRAARSAV
jgi:V/A-type H+-transporting ATPase subunit D